MFPAQKIARSVLNQAARHVRAKDQTWLVMCCHVMDVLILNRLCLSFCPAGNFWCPADATGGLQCYGRTGVEILDSIHANFPAFESDVNVLLDQMILLAIALFFKACYAIRLLLTCRKIALPQAVNIVEEPVATKA